MFSSLCLLVLLGAVLVSAAPKQFITENLKSSQNLIADELGLKKPEVGSSPLFSSIIKSFNTTCQTSEDLELINATMDVYARIFSSVLHQNQSHHHLQGAPSLLSHVSDAQRSNVVSELTSLQQVMENLRSRLHQRDVEKKELLAKISRIQVDDPMIQKKALAEINEVYQLASMVYTRSHH